MAEDNYGIWFNGHHSSEFGLRVVEGKRISFPTKQKALVPIPYSSTVYDYTSVVGTQAYGERTFVIPFNIEGSDQKKESMYVKWTSIVNWLTSTIKKTPLYDDIMKDYYYMAEVINAPDFEEFRLRGVLTIEFTCYPFRISKLREGNDIWDTFNFELDVAQTTTFEVKRNGVYKSIPIGSFVNLGAWSTHFSGGVAINRNIVSRFYKVLNVQSDSNGNSKLSYQLEGVDGRVYEQDVVQAQTEVTKATLINNGTNAVVPIIKTTESPTGLYFERRITIKKGNQYFNLYDPTTNDGAFLLPPGVSNLEITGINTTVDFEFYKEVL